MGSQVKDLQDLSAPNVQANSEYTVGSENEQNPNLYREADYLERIEHSPFIVWGNDVIKTVAAEVES